ncbi:hypothetical protein DMC30DRAFT_414918 [Rhodotorula diobovata]|uniref:phosphatidylinositol-3,4,5-trisphosphate 3-phosphatase n=1 Tax=Rhodotorula diobovata TaxID=5288 RepID=A0A5C5G0M1_9BASI|nr:hypothetical protein DMC30DRAFT_414918 [Rhodotorula diobovata]
MFDPLRRLVSGRKARLEEDGFSLDLVQLTERIIVMGFPAEGTAQLYRNKLSDVQRYLSQHEGHFRIFNLCPRAENSYDASNFGGEVRRFPWPDHHPPPLSLVPLMVAEARSWYEEDDRNVVVIHCKAGKGRSGTFALSLLLALPGLPSAPALSSDGNSSEDAKSEKDAVYGPLDPRAVLGRSSGDISSLSLQDKLEYLLRFHTLRRMAPGAKSYGVSIASQRRLLGYWARLLDGEDPRSPAPGDRRRVVLEYIKVSGKGVSGLGKLAAGGSDRIAVQVYRYKDSIEASLRAKELALSSDSPRERFDDDEWDDRDDMIVHVGGLSESSSGTASLASSAPGTPARAASPPRADGGGALRSGSSTASGSTASLPTIVRGTPMSSANSSETDLPPPSGTHAQVESEPAAAPPRERVLVPATAFLAPDASERRSREDAAEAVEADGGIVLDAEREVQLRFLLGKTGDKHSKLSAMAALALTWFVPVFEVDAAAPGAQSKVVFKGKDLDFRKPFAGIDEVEFGWRWL